MNWMIYPAARAFIKVCAVFFGTGAAAAVLIHLFMPFFLRSPPDSRALPAFGNRGGTALHPFPVLPHVLGRQSSAGLPRKQNNKKSEHAGLPARPVRPPHSVCGHARPIAIYGNGQGLGGLPPSGGRHFFLFLPLYGGIRSRRQEIIPGLGHRRGRLRFAERPVFSCRPVASVPVHRSSLPGNASCMGWPFFCPAAWKSCWRPFPFFWRSACLKRSCP